MSTIFDTPFVYYSFRNSLLTVTSNSNDHTFYDEVLKQLNLNKLFWSQTVLSLYTLYIRRDLEGGRKKDFYFIYKVGRVFWLSFTI